MIAILLLLAGAVERDDGFVRDHCDLVEVNHYFDALCKLTFDQVIWWDLDEHGDYRVVAWRILQGVRCTKSPRARHDSRPEFIGGHATPTYDHDRKRWVSRWFDEKGKTRREVSTICHRETWTQYDPEVQDRSALPTALRRGLKKPSHAGLMQNSRPPRPQVFPCE